MRLAVEKTVSLFLYYFVRTQSPFSLSGRDAAMSSSLNSSSEFEKVLACLVLTYHDAVNSFDEIIVSINEHLAVTSSQPYIINIKFTADCI